MTNPAQLPDVLQLIDSAYMVAGMHHQALAERWVALSHQLGSTLPHSRLPVSIQRCGRLDVLVRSVEDEFVKYGSTSEQVPFLAAEILGTLSETWIGSIYAILAVLRRMKLKIANLEELYEDIRLIRVVLEKHEIPSDRMLKEQINQKTDPSYAGDPRIFTYNKDDPRRSHIMPTGINPQGSVCWRVPDLKNKAERWLARRYISDRALGLNHF